MYSILIVEDEPRIRMGIQKHIPWSELGFRVVADATSGEEALAKFAEYRPDVILTDIRMDNLNGLSLMREIRKQCGTTKFVILSGYSEFDYARQSMQYGASAYLLKPMKNYEFREVFQRIRIELDHEQNRTYTADQPALEADGPMGQALLYIQQHYDEKITLVDISERVYMSASYFSKVFKQRVGVTFIEYLTDLRIEKAKDLLRNTGIRISEIAVSVGYDDVRHFSKVFKAKEGCSPREFRERLDIRSDEIDQHQP